MVATAKKDKTAGKKRATKGQALDEIRELLERIEAKEVEVEAAESDLETARDEAKIKKGVWLTRVNELRELVRTRRRWAEEAKRQPLLNQKPKDAKPAEPAQAGANGDGAPTVVASDALGDEWKLRTFAAAGFEEKHQDALEGAGLRTLGDLQSKMNQHGQFWAREIGVSGRIRVAIEDAFNRYLNELAAEPSAEKGAFA